MNSLDMRRTDYLNLMFISAADPLSEGYKGLECFLEALETHAGDLMPTRVHLVGADIARWNRKRKYSRALIQQMFDEERATGFFPPCFGFDKTSSPNVSLMLGLSKNPDFKSRFNLSMEVLPFSYFKQEAARAEERSRGFISLMRAWAIHYPPIYAFAHSAADWVLAHDPNNRVLNLVEQLHEFYWLNLLGKDLVDLLGRERVLSTPVFLVEELPGGTVLLVSNPTPDFASEEARRIQARALVHLRPDLSFDSVLARLRERSATLAPVTPAFVPDLAPLLTLTLDGVDVSERQREIARLNAYRPPEVTQWVPLHQAPASDVEDVQAGIALNEGNAQHLMAILRRKVPSVLTRTPESLTDVDFHFWHFHYPDEFRKRRKELSTYAGAYLGMVMVRHLHGRWVPRRTLEESQVVVGRRAWFPFQRAFDALENRQSLIDYSLTGFYRAAEHHLLASRGPLH